MKLPQNWHLYFVAKFSTCARVKKPSSRIVMITPPNMGKQAIFRLRHASWPILDTLQKKNIYIYIYIYIYIIS